MDEQEGHSCPECGTPRGADNTPACTCTERASEALRDARTAEQAAAEDFDPLRIRPYVELNAERETTTPPPDPEATAPLRQLDEPVPPDLSLFESPPNSPPPDSPAQPTAHPDEEDTRPSHPRRRRTVLLSLGGGVVAVVTAAGLASGLFSYETPTRDGAASDDVRASVPDTTPSASSTEPSASAPSEAPTPDTPKPTRSDSPSPPPASPSRTTASPTTSHSAAATPTPTGSATGSGNDSDDNRRTGQSVLRLGDEGPEVTELQERLHQLYLYNGEPDGTFSTQVEDAVRNYQWSKGLQVKELGVYDAPTRTKLESETTEP